MYAFVAFIVHFCVCIAKIAQLPSDQQTEDKASSDRLRQSLPIAVTQAEATTSSVAGMDRMSLQEATARQKLQRPSDAEQELNTKKLEFEMRKFEREAELELARMAEKKKERERAERKKERQTWPPDHEDEIAVGRKRKRKGERDREDKVAVLYTSCIQAACFMYAV